MKLSSDKSGYCVELNKAVISNPHGFDIGNQSARTGVPISVGLLDETADLCLVSQNNQMVDYTAHVSSHWSDGSARWVLIEMLANVDFRQQITLDLYLEEKKAVCRSVNASLSADANCLTGPEVFEFAAEGIEFCPESGSGQVLLTTHSGVSNESAFRASRLELVMAVLPGMHYL